MRSENRSKRYAASCGPAAASGWYCTENLSRSPAGERSSRPSTTSSLRQTWLTVATPYGVGGRVEGRVHREAVVVRGDLDLAGGAVHHRLVDAPVVVRELEVPNQRPAEELVAEADAEVRQPVERRLQQLDLGGGGRRVTGAVGEEEPVGPPSSAHRATSSSEAVAGSTWLSMLRSLSIRGVFAPRPRSTTATVKRGSPTAGTTAGLRVETASLRLAPAISAESRTRWSRAVGSVSAEEMPTRIAPCSRSRRVSARVSIPEMPTTRLGHAGRRRASAASASSGARAGSRTTYPATQMR